MEDQIVLDLDSVKRENVFAHEKSLTNTESTKPDMGYP